MEVSGMREIFRKPDRKLPTVCAVGERECYFA